MWTDHLVRRKQWKSEMKWAQDGSGNRGVEKTIRQEVL